ncbi:hypothetical protein Q5P01_023535 [Channa striata]|uniref:Uncharacterized protein n=1 Tax=Channa striata TaxID=64152 RepID=A0AA88IPF6_CHASR|nr:hypothetical protein Q5P01_023535 [Channa striata]
MKEVMGTQMQQQSVSVTDEVSQVPSIQAVVRHFHPSFTAESGGSVVAPSIIGSTIGNLNISITSTGQGCYDSSKEGKKDGTDDILCAQQPQNFKIAECREKLKVSLKRKFTYLVEGNTTEANKIPLNKIYTELYITQGGTGDVNKEHEVRQIEIASRAPVLQEKSIHCNHLFVPLPGRDPHIRTVITRGVAGIGKTVSANKFTLDWAEGTANTNLDFVFPLSFRELNLMRKKNLSFVDLLSVFFPETKDTGIFTNGKNEMLFILDGLDESRLSLDFNKTEIVSDVMQPTTVAVLLINLIRGRLLPSAFIWITSRPAASSQIPHDYIDLLTEVRGFNNQQKDDYFRRKIGDEALANRVIMYVKSCRSLHIMCHIPVFCWMAASVLEKKLVTKNSKDTPKTLTQMYIHFLSMYVGEKNKRLVERRESNADCTRENLLSLGKLAFKELEKGRLIFYESDLIQNGINVAQASMFSGVYTQIFNEDLTLCKEKTFCFVHLSIQEFFAALYVFLMFHNDNNNVLVKKSSASRLFQFRNSSEVILYKEAVEKSLWCENGHYDINRTNHRTRTETIKHIKERIRSSQSTERCLNLFTEIQSFLSLGRLDKANLSPAQWSTLVFVLLTSENELNVFELSNYSRSEDCLLRMLPVVKTARLSQITDLDISDNNLTDEGIKLLSVGVKNSKVETLRLRSCNLTELSSDAVASVISSASCPLTVLDLADNDFQDIGVSRLSKGLSSPHCKLEKLDLSLCRVTEEGCTFLASALNSSRLIELDLSYNHPGNLGLQLLSALLDEPQCSLQKLSVGQCGESRIQPGPRKCPSIQAVVQQHPSLTAQSSSNVVAPSIISSKIENLTINVTSTGQGCYVSSDEALKDDTDVTDAQQVQNFKIEECREKLKVSLKRKFTYLLEGNTANKIPLNKIYTELYITQGGTGDVNKEHEVRQIEIASRAPVLQEKSIHCNHLFVPPPGRDPHIRTVITRGVAGIGKTVSANKFTLDWAEGTANTNLDFVFPLSFRELNLMIEKNVSFVDLLSVFFPETKDTGIFTNGKNEMLFILDGLDESRLALDFDISEIVSDVMQPTTVAVLLINLIRGRLLPSAFIWITSRPAASSQIPHDYIDLLTDVRGFNNQQKDDYFRRKIGDEAIANRVITYVKSCRSLHIMCHIPVFCWMAAGVLEKELGTEDSKDTPKTLTQMYIHFLYMYVENTKKRLPERRESNADCTRENLLSLGKLAFKELEKGRLIFYESDLIQNGINVAQASMFSGVYTQIFNEDLTLCKEKTFCFVHLSIQEFFAALYVFLMFHNDNNNVLVKKSSASRLFQFRNSSEVILYKEAVEKSLRCENGHYDMFLRFLLGLSLESNHTLLKHLMTSNRTNHRTRTETIKHIKERIRSSQSTERCLNLFHCLNDLNDHSLVEEIQSFLSLGRLDKANLSPAQWSTLVFVLLTSENELNVFELSNYSRSEDCLLRMLPVVKTARVANLSACNLTMSCCDILASGISSSQISDLDLSNNSLTDEGIKLLSVELRRCNLTELSSDAVASVISSASCPLTVLDLADNDFQDIGVSRLSKGLSSPHCKLEKLDLSLCRVTEEGCTFLASALNSSRLRELDLSYNHPGNLGLQLLSALLDEPQCSLQKLSVGQCGESRIHPAPRKYMKKLTLDPNTAHKDLSLSEGNRRAKRWTAQQCPDHPERFDFWTQVLCTEGLTERCYWETEWSGKTFIGVAYRRMCRKGEGHDSWLGRNDFSWGLSCNKDGYRISHNGMNTAVTTPPNSNKVGVYLDWSAGTLSFYRVCCGELTLLHTFRTTFTEPVYPGFWVSWVDSAIYLC